MDGPMITDKQQTRAITKDPDRYNQIQIFHDQTHEKGKNLTLQKGGLP